ncbi:MAG: alpha/beta hydrolase [Actinocatenispora sp.]
MSYQRIQVRVAGGTLTGAIWGDDGPVVLAVHGVTSSHLAWAAVARKLTGVRLVAVDLRGRGDSGALPGPYGMAQHAADCVAVLDALGVAGPVPVTGHSMGGFVAVVLADEHPDRVSRLVLVDGGPPLPAPPGDPMEALAASIGPAADRLRRRFADRAQYRDFWRAHPALYNWTPDLESYVDYDLTGEEPELRSKVSLDAVREDSVDLLTGDTLPAAWRRLRHDALLLRAERGMLDEEIPMYPDVDALTATLPVRTVPGTNHYTILLGDPGAVAVASALQPPS